MHSGVLKRLAGLVLLAFVLVGAAAPLRAADLTVSAAASLTNAFQELKPLFEKANPGVNVLFNFAASGPLLKQIEAGAPVDVFASADQETMDQAASKKLMAEGTRKDFVANSLVMITPSDSKLGLKQVKDLTGAPVARIAVGNPDSVPVGRYTRDSLTKDGLYETLKPKFVQGESVRQVLDYVSRGEVQAGFVYMTDAMIAKDKVSVAATMGGHAPITYPIAVVAASANKDMAAKFTAFVLSAEGQAVLAKYGFKKP
ncbi:molybdate ABC transporter substrate-binding protein [Fundidesulfovibrio terrae]|uniref:molybdate ABC transporter substrate-binding protein n=1 Tax=Fundidesulfovibrio terrae TaxID=2922866 RepID=UPI001FAE990D|nr:molybdate ABC transporter substrate-binding protein [Fundidesulfovibrio terrae]